MKDEVEELYIDGGCEVEGFDNVYAEGAYTDKVGMEGTG